jgi:hypothetical protein
MRRKTNLRRSHKECEVTIELAIRKNREQNEVSNYKKTIKIAQKRGKETERLKQNQEAEQG